MTHLESHVVAGDSPLKVFFLSVLEDQHAGETAGSTHRETHRASWGVHDSIGQVDISARDAIEGYEAIGSGITTILHWTASKVGVGHIATGSVEGLANALDSWGEPV